MTMKTLPELQSLGQTEEGKDRLRVMLAEALGWEGPRFGSRGWRAKPPGTIRYYRHSIPDYPRDLNAVHEVELGLDTQTERLWRAYLEQICRTMGGMLHANATQRTIALISVLQKP